MAVVDTFRALGDPVRLKIVQRLRPARPCTISSVSRGLGMTRQGARRHLQVLADARLVALEPRGRDVLVHLQPQHLEQARAFIAELEHRWDTRLEALKAFVEENNVAGEDDTSSR